MTPEDETSYLQYELSDGRTILLVFDNLNDRDGCHISLDMYRANLGPIDDAVALRMAGKFQGRLLEHESQPQHGTSDTR